MDNEMIAAAILAAGFVSAQRVALSGGVLEDTLKEKYVEFLAFIRERKTAESTPRTGAGESGGGRRLDGAGRSRGSQRKK
jgi:hypothetical protein